MKFTNVTTIKDFIIIGFPGLPLEYYGPISALLLFVFLAIVFGNTFVVAVIVFERTLHKPTYLIFSNLAMTDLIYGTVTLPKIIARYWWNHMISSFGACFVQMYFVHSLGAIHSLILLIMALDRFIAIWVPFQYPVLFSNKTTSVACSLCWILTCIRMMGIVLHAHSLPYCDLNIIKQCFCDHNSITNLACGDMVRYVKWVAFANAMVTLLVPLTFIIFSYFAIIIAVLKISQTDRRYKMLSTCLPQIIITCLYYVPRCIVYLSDILGLHFNVDARMIIPMMYSLIPAAVNPLIYCFKTADIKKALIQRFKRSKISSAFNTDYMKYPK
ncbi:olfactory receptor 2AT4-like [Cololabis saira]|uniref:olfactory receptor 2AT4-like n=1 Tax=Cololabis saira TaxID=129043 RepID=UPI002AD2D491|nr:olfactory receptor 2AT4-like [Cololabis saira]